MQLQVTLIDKTNKYKPLSTLVDIPSIEEYNENKTKYLKSAIQKICCKMRINPNTFKQDYDIKARIYDKEKIEREKKIKALMYQACKNNKKD